MATLETLNEINDFVREYLRFHNMSGTLDSFEGETDRKSKTELVLDKDFKELNKKYNMVIQGARQIFSVSINFIQSLMAIKEIAGNDSVLDLLESYRIQLGKYHKIVLNEGRLEGNELITETVMQEHKQKFLKHLKDSNIDSLVEVLLSLRVNALQIAPELRKNLVYELIRNDIFTIEAENNFLMVLKILSIDNPSLKHAVTSLISVISSTLKGVEYLTHGGDMSIIRAVIKILKSCEMGSVTQRFCIAILQKSSIKETVIPTLIESNMVFWVLDLLNDSLTKKVHVFCLDFSSALLANIMHSPHTTSFLENNPDIAKRVLENMLNLIRSNVPVSVLMHVLISISYFSKDNFAKLLEDLRFVDRISKFVERYSQINTTDNEALEIDKKTVLDLCAHMFHPKDISMDHSESMDGMDLRSEDRIREYENEQGELIFECFQDEVN